MKISRYKEWWKALRKANRQVAWWLLVWRMGKALWSGRVSRAEWRRRMKKCQHCPIYLHGLKRCGPRNGLIFKVKGEVGCGCYVPFVALTAAPYKGAGGRGCWGRAAFGGKFGWGEPGEKAQPKAASGLS